MLKRSFPSERDFDDGLFLILSVRFVYAQRDWVVSFDSREYFAFGVGVGSGSVAVGVCVVTGGDVCADALPAERAITAVAISAIRRIESTNTSSDSLVATLSRAPPQVRFLTGLTGCRRSVGLNGAISGPPIVGVPQPGDTRNEAWRGVRPPVNPLPSCHANSQNPTFSPGRVRPS